MPQVAGDPARQKLAGLKGNILGHPTFMNEK